MAASHEVLEHGIVCRVLNVNSSSGASVAGDAEKHFKVVADVTFVQ